MKLNLQFDNEDEAQYGLEAIEFALFEAEKQSEMRPKAKWAKREVEALKSIKQKFITMLEGK